MKKRSRISQRFIASEFSAAMSDDWNFSYSMFRYQISKEMFNFRHPFGAKHGKGDGLQLIGLRITDMCNLRCHSCGQWGDNGYLRDKSLRELKAREVPLETYKNLVDQIVELGWSPVWYIWGGEPMVYPGMIDLLYYISERGMHITLVSNGTHIAKYAKEMSDTCKVLYLSVDGSNAKIHDQQRPAVARNHSNFAAVESALEAIRAEKEDRNSPFPYIVPLSCITVYNIDDVVELYRFASQYADAHVFYLTWWIDKKSAEEHTQDFERRFGSKPETHYGWIGKWNNFDHGIILDKYEEMHKIWKNERRSIPMMMPELRTKEEINRYYKEHSETFDYKQCVSIYMTMEIDSNGDVSLCRDYHDYTIGNIRNDRVEDIWNNERAIKFRKSISSDGLMPACRRCCGLMGF